MTRRYTGVVTQEEDWYVARCLELDVTSQGRSIEQAKANLHEALELYIESFGADDLPGNVEGMMLYPVEVTANA